jgi:hypothetical protein
MQRTNQLICDLISSLWTALTRPYLSDESPRSVRFITVPTTAFGRYEPFE